MRKVLRSVFPPTGTQATVDGPAETVDVPASASVATLLPSAAATHEDGAVAAAEEEAGGG